jgi:8-oxo-dGTP pyrophosphatase MutT (NUDIX family)
MGKHDNFIDQIRYRLTQPLPGRDAQLKMAFSRRAEELRLNPNPPADARVACVTLLLWENNQDWHTVMIQRPANPHDRHGGQVSFPGGKQEKEDASLRHTAIRETHEELGVAPEQLEMLGQLTELYIPVSNFLVHPFVALLSGEPRFIPQPGEVESILTPSLDHFRQAENKGLKELVVGTGVLLKDVPCYMVEERAVWGATAMIMSEFLAVLG